MLATQTHSTPQPDFSQSRDPIDQIPEKLAALRIVPESAIARTRDAISALESANNLWGLRRFFSIPAKNNPLLAATILLEQAAQLPVRELNQSEPASPPFGELALALALSPQGQVDSRRVLDAIRGGLPVSPLKDGVAQMIVQRIVESLRESPICGSQANRQSPFGSIPAIDSSLLNVVLAHRINQALFCDDQDLGYPMYRVMIQPVEFTWNELRSATSTFQVAGLPRNGDMKFLRFVGVVVDQRPGSDDSNAAPYYLDYTCLKPTSGRCALPSREGDGFVGTACLPWFDLQSEETFCKILETIADQYEKGSVNELHRCMRAQERFIDGLRSFHGPRQNLTLVEQDQFINACRVLCEDWLDEALPPAAVPLFRGVRVVEVFESESERSLVPEGAAWLGWNVIRRDLDEHLQHQEKGWPVYDLVVTTPRLAKVIQRYRHSGAQYPNVVQVERDSNTSAGIVAAMAMELKPTVLRDKSGAVGFFIND